MKTRMSYDDDIFFLQTMIKTLRSGLALEIDADLFKEKVLEDVFFIDATLMKILSALRENPNLIRRSDYLKALGRAQNAFIGYLEDLIAEERPLAQTLSPHAGKLRDCRDSHRRSSSEVQEMLHHPDAHSPEEDVVSREELSYLLSDTTEDASEQDEE
ncbi:MAG: hypothetical protein ACLFUX_10340 [Spirochaetaceae bacterium]